jgi:hypothetical protein
MARSLPNIDASPLVVRDAINAHLEGFPMAPFMRAPGYDINDEGSPLIASDADVTQLAASMTQFALDSMVCGLDPTFMSAAYLIGYKKAWVFSGPFDTWPLNCPHAPDEERSAAVPLTSNERQCFTDLLNEVMTNADSDNSNSANVAS